MGPFRRSLSRMGGQVKRCPVKPQKRLLAASCVMALLLVLSGCHPQQAVAPTSHGSVAPASPLRFVDVTTSAGIAFHHDSGATGKKYLPETMGSGCAFLDYDGDGYVDILLLNGHTLDAAKGAPPTHPSCTLYHNNGNGTFTDVTHESGLDVPIYAMGVAVGDYDNDGYPDIYITTVLGTNRLFHNRGKAAFADASGHNAKPTGPIFEEVTAQAGVGDSRWGSSAAWVDYDNDGYLDLFVCRYVRYRSLADDKDCSTRSGQKSYCPPDMYDGETCILYHNNGDGTFTDVTQQTGIAQAVGTSLGVAVFDYDGDGWPDLVVANDKRPNFLFHNVPASGGKRAFQEVALEAGLALDAQGVPKAGMGIDTADCNNDGKLCVAVSNFSNEGLSLFRQDKPGLFVDVGAQAGLVEPSFLMVGFGLLFADFDNDGWQDLISINGHVFPESSQNEQTVTYQERKLLFHNEGGGHFREIGASCGDPFARLHVGRGAAIGDFDNDGRLDILINNNNEAPELLHNESTATGNWLQIEVLGGMRPGRKPHGRQGLSNRDALGAKVTVHAGGQTLTQWVHSGSSYQSASMHGLHFGLGKATEADSIEVRFPGGATVSRQHMKANQRLEIDEA